MEWSVGKLGLFDAVPAVLRAAIAQAITLLAVIVAWVFFRAETFDGAILVLEGMFGLTRFHQVNQWDPILVDTGLFWGQCLILAVIVLFAPNAIELVRKYRPVVDMHQIAEGLRALDRKTFWRHHRPGLLRGSWLH